MTKKKLFLCDAFLILSLIIGGIILLLYSKTYLVWQDEGFYPTIALRLINGDSLISDEWHLSQFSSLFLYLPVKLWLTINGSTDGLILFMRYLFLGLQTSGCIAIYFRFRKNGLWAIAAAMIFLSQSPMSISSINYNSLFAFFLLLLGLLLSYLSTKQNTALFITAGILFGCMCICNPFSFFLFIIYCIYCLLRHYYDSATYKRYCKKYNRAAIKKGKKEKRTPFLQTIPSFLFSKNSFIAIFLGAFLMFIVLVIFYFATGGSLSAIGDNFSHLLTDSEHDIFNSPLAAFFDKIKRTLQIFNTIHFKVPYIIPALFAALLFDKKSKSGNRRIVYVFVCAATAIFCAIGVLAAAMKDQSTSLFWSYPLFLLSLCCYIMTNNKNKNLFYFFFLPCVFACAVQYLASNLLFTSIGWVLAVGNVAGVFFIKDFATELKDDPAICKKGFITAVSILLSVLITAQCAYQFLPTCLSSSLDTQESRLIETGPLKGLYIDSKFYGTHVLNMQDLDKIKTRNKEDAPVLILSKMCWLYLYLDCPFGVYSAWQNSFEPDRLQAYYTQNPQKSPKYIYISAVNPFNGYSVSFKDAQNTADVILEIFNCKVEKLSRGYLLTVVN